MEGHEVQNLGTVGEPGTQRGEVAASGTWRGNALTEAGRCEVWGTREVAVELWQVTSSIRPRNYV